MTELPTGTVTFLFTDVEGSTKLLHELGAEAYAEALAEHRRLIRKACAAEDGVEVDTQGDAFFFSFPKAPAAVDAAQAMTEALASGPIQVRIGLHTGAPLLTGEGYVGDDVHFAARVASAGHGGQVILSAATAKVVQLPLTDLGEHRLKDITEAVQIFQLGDGSFPPLKTISNTNLPTPASSFVGRDDELLEVLSRFEEGARLVTLTGPGGTGKTRLAIEAAATLVPEYKAGVFWIGLATLRDPALVTETIAQTLGAKDGLAEHIADREMLLLLDNLEQVVDCAPELSELLSEGPNLNLLITSRELLRIQGEVEYAVPPLAEPEAVSLFCERAQLEPSGEVAELCRRLDDMPLAVELAAARTSVLTPAQILERFAQRLDLLKGGRDADPRQQTLRTTIEWSYDLLTEDERRLLARLSVFAGGCTLEAAEEVCDAALDTLQSLVEKSLLRFTESRYWMLETIREYAREHLAERGEEAWVRQRHGDFARRLVATAEPELIGERQLVWHEILEREQDNIREALAFLRDAGDTAGELELVGGLWDFWYLRGNWVEGRRWTEGALSRSVGQVTVQRAKALNAAAGYAEKLGDSAATRVHAEEALAVSRELDDPRGMGEALLGLSLASRLDGDRERTVELLEQAVEMARADPEQAILADALGSLAFCAMEEEDYDRAIVSSDEVTMLFRVRGDDAGVAWARGIALNCLVCTGRDAEALDVAEEVLPLASDTGAVAILAGVLGLVACAFGRQGNATVGATLMGAEDALREHVHLQRTGAYVPLHKAIADELRGSLGVDRYEEAFAKGRELSMHEAVAYALASLG